MAISRLRVIAGPNGSGKSTLFKTLQNEVQTGIWVNADDLLFTFNKLGFAENIYLGFIPTKDSFFKFVNKKAATAFIQEFNLKNEVKEFQFGIYNVAFPKKKMTNECAALFADYLRYMLTKLKISFTAETVFSHPSKLDLIKLAKANNFKTYLYFIATASPTINIGRISGRVSKGGHFVSDDKVRKRYENSIALISKHIKLFDRVFIFDNSANTIDLIVSFYLGKLEKVYVEKIPDWVQNILQ
ncbi:MAG: hypothetical protein ABIX01_15310 [Chitinophagaceae bacterium]